MIATQEALDAFCQRMSTEPFLAVDTEFLRDKTYWPQLCLVQVAGTDEAAAIDPLADGIDLAPLHRLMNDPGILKVFHAARQDLEIFFHLTGTVPAPLFDTQVAAMVCGFGESASYETLASKLARAQIDKSSRFTDWSARPLTDKQLSYALSDVTHLRVVYDKLNQRLIRAKRAHWIAEEMAILSDPATYRLDPEQAWVRLRPRTNNPRFLSILRELASWREQEAQRRNLPRNRLLRDEALLEVAATAPTGTSDLARSRSLTRGIVEGPIGDALLAAVARGAAVPTDQAPRMAERADLPPGRAPLVELLKVLLKTKCEQHDVAQKLIASSADLEHIACSDTANVPALQGWRREVFGDDALALKRGQLALTAQDDGIALVRLDQTPAGA